MRLRRALVALLIVLAATGCSETRTYRQDGGHCIVHDTSRIFGLPVNQTEWNCDDDG